MPVGESRRRNGIFYTVYSSSSISSEKQPLLFAHAGMPGCPLRGLTTLSLQASRRNPLTGFRAESLPAVHVFFDARRRSMTSQMPLHLNSSDRFQSDGILKQLKRLAQPIHRQDSLPLWTREPQPAESRSHA
jgi:hypothetical protein